MFEKPVWSPAPRRTGLDRDVAPLAGWGPPEGGTPNLDAHKMGDSDVMASGVSRRGRPRAGGGPDIANHSVHHRRLAFQFRAQLYGRIASAFAVAPASTAVGFLPVSRDHSGPETRVANRVIIR